MDTILSTNDLTIGYPQSRQPDVVISKDLSLRLHRGELVCLLGPNGAGKSTLLRTMAAMQPNLHGEILLMGDEIRSLKPKDLARRISVVLTDHVDAGNLSGYGLVALGRHPYTDWMGRLSPQDKAVIREAIESVGAAGLADRKINELSDGERQKMMIARALAQEPAVMILDEPTAFLDLPHRANVMRILRDLAHKTQRAILLSTHDLDLALRSADRIWLMDKHGGLQTGAPEDLILNGAFQETFSSEGIEFDLHSGSFQFISNSGDLVEVIGDGMNSLWTERALVRAGFVVASNGHTQQGSKIQVKVIEAQDGPRWQVTDRQQTTEHPSIYELIQHISLRQENNGYQH